MHIKPVFEFLLWDNCNNDCQFCYQKRDYHPLTLQQKVQSIDKVLDFLQSNAYIKGSHVLLVGGEIFDDRQVFPYMKKLIDNIVNMMVVEDIDLLYINTNLLYKDISCVCYLLDAIQSIGAFPRLKFTTSYDEVGRFKNDKHKNLMLTNLKQLTLKYTGLKVVVNAMLSNLMCKNMLNGTFDVRSFYDEYRCDINFIPYIVLDPRISATRNQIFSALHYVDQLLPGYVKAYVANFDLKQEKL